MSVKYDQISPVLLRNTVEKWPENSYRKVYNPGEHPKSVHSSICVTFLRSFWRFPEVIFEIQQHGDMGIDVLCQVVYVLQDINFFFFFLKSVRCWGGWCNAAWGGDLSTLLVNTGVRVREPLDRESFKQVRFRFVHFNRFSVLQANFVTFF